MTAESKRAAFARAVDGFRQGRPVLVLAHNDADGLSAAAVFARALPRAGYAVRARIVGRGESPWSDEIRSEIGREDSGGLIVTDLGIRSDIVLPDTPTVFVDHHVPRGSPPGATVISGYNDLPTPNSSLLAYWCAGALTDVDDLLWIAALGIIGDLGDRADFAELAAARQRYGATVLREATSLINAPRRAGSGDARPAFDLLMKAEGPRDLISDKHPESELLRRARAEVNAALQTAKRIAPKIKGKVALILLDSPCQLHPLVAQAWRGRLKNNIVIAANTGYRPGWVHFSARSATGVNLVEFLRDKAPRGADENYGGGHEQAAGGALPPAAWNEFVETLGFGPDLRVDA